MIGRRLCSTAVGRILEAGRCRRRGLQTKRRFLLDITHQTAGLCDGRGFSVGVDEAQRKKKQDYSEVEFLTISEGLCVQCMHIGAYDDEPSTVAVMDQFIREKGYENDFSGTRMHHKIYLSDARRVAPEKLKTVIRHPIKRMEK